MSIKSDGGKPLKLKLIQYATSNYGCLLIKKSDEPRKRIHSAKNEIEKLPV